MKFNWQKTKWTWTIEKLQIIHPPLIQKLIRLQHDENMSKINMAATRRKHVKNWHGCNTSKTCQKLTLLQHDENMSKIDMAATIHKVEGLEHVSNVTSVNHAWKATYVCHKSKMNMSRNTRNLPVLKEGGNFAGWQLNYDGRD